MKQKGALSVALAAMAALALAGCNSGGGGGGGGGASGPSVVAVVGDKEITRDELHQHLEGSNGASSLAFLIQYSQAEQKMKSEGLEITDEELQKALENRALQSPAADNILKGKGPQLETLKRNERFNLMLDKLLTKDIKVDEAALKKWFDQRKDYYRRPMLVKFGVLLTSTKTRADILAKDLKSKAKTFNDLVEQQKKAADQMAAGSTNETPEYFSLARIYPEWRGALTSQKINDISPVIAFNGGAAGKGYAILRVLAREESVVPNFTAMRAKAEADYKLEQVAKGIVDSDPRSKKFTWTQIIQDVYGRLQQQAGKPDFQPTYHQALSYLSQPAASQLIGTMQGEGKVEIKDDNYKELKESFKAAAAAPGAISPAGAPVAPGKDSAGHEGHGH